MKRKTLLTICLLVVAALASWAQGPNGSGSYYKNADGLAGEELKTKLFTIISQKQRQLTYGDLWEVYKITDTRADGCVRDWYSNATYFKHITNKAGNYSKEGDVYNREHSVPQSWGAPVADIVHVVPTDGYVNNRRSNYPFGEVGTATYQSSNGYSKLGSCKTEGYSGVVFEPNDEVKGDLARIYFYIATCYESTITSWSGGGVITGTKYQPYAQWTFDMMMRWSKLDPVDDVERARNAAIARSDVQGNRNPFVDYPGLEEYIWGSKKDVPFSYANYEGGGGDVVIDDPVDETPADATIALNNSCFGTAFTGALSESMMGSYSAMQSGITVTYSKAEGTYQYISDSQIRLYQGNTLTVSVGQRAIAKMEFTVVKNDKSKILSADVGSVDGYVWTGNANSVTFSVNSGGGHLQLSAVKVTLAAEPVPVNPIPGDVDGDGVVSWADVSALIKGIWEGQAGGPADVNGDGRVDVADILSLLRLM